MWRLWLDITRTDFCVTVTRGKFSDPSCFEITSERWRKSRTVHIVLYQNFRLIAFMIFSIIKAIILYEVQRIIHHFYRFPYPSFLQKSFLKCETNQLIIVFYLELQLPNCLFVRTIKNCTYLFSKYHKPSKK
jgi:hypothetical protein